MSKSQFQKEYEEYQKYKEWQEVLCCKNAQEVIDFVMSNYLTEDEKCKTIAEQSQRIAELEEQLKNAPKYTDCSKVFFIDACEKIIKEDFVEKITINHRDGIYYELMNDFLFEECELFATKEEAQAKLQELQGE